MRKALRNIKSKPAEALLEILGSALTAGLLAYVLLSLSGVTGNAAVAWFSLLFGALLYFGVPGAVSAAAVAAVSMIFLKLTPADYFLWLLQLVSGERTEDGGRALFTVLLFSLAAAFLCRLLFRLRLYYFASAFCVAGLILCWLLYGDSVGCAVVLLSLMALLFYFLGSYHSFLSKNKSAGMPFPVFAANLIPCCAVVAAAAFLLPKSSQPIIAPALDSLYNSIYERFAVIWTQNGSILTAAFNNDTGRLGGPAYPDSIQVLSVTAPDREYLKCSVKDQYTGYSWKNTVNDSYPMYDSRSELEQSQFEMMNGMKYLSGREDGDYPFLKSNRMKITFLHLFINYLFLPVHVQNVDTAENENTEFGGTVFLKSRKFNGYLYDVRYISVDYSDKAFVSLLRGSRTDLYESLFQKNAGDARLKELCSRAQKIKSTYLALPGRLPQRVRALAKQITQGKGSDYDKAKAIEKYLNQNEAYTLTPPQAPLGSDFVDNFLFVSHQGYCTSYASAMAVLARCAGLPARYCEGYRMPETKDTDGNYTVTNEQAHAWAELYFEGFGWVPFEATSAYSNGFYEKAKQTGTALPQGSALSAAPRKTNEVSSSAVSPSSAAPRPQIRPPVSKPAAAGGRHGRLYLFVPAAFLLMILSLSALCFLNAEKCKRRNAKAARLPPKDGIVFLYGSYRKILKCARLCGSADETPNELAARLRGEGKLPPGFDKITALFCAARYSRADVTRADFEAVYDYGREMIRWFILNRGKARYVIERYFFGRI